MAAGASQTIWPPKRISLSLSISQARRYSDGRQCASVRLELNRSLNKHGQSQLGAPLRDSAGSRRQVGGCGTDSVQYRPAEPNRHSRIRFYVPTSTRSSRLRALLPFRRAKGLSNGKERRAIWNDKSTRRLDS